MSYETVRPMWDALRQRFQKRVEAMDERELEKRLGETSIGDLLYHTAEVEYLFSEWFFNSPTQEKVLQPTTLDEYIILLQHSNEHVVKAIASLRHEDWGQVKQSSFGNSTPLEAIGRLMNHTGMHGGQISFVQKYGLFKGK